MRINTTAIIILLVASGLTFSTKNLQQKTLPVCVEFTDSTLNNTEFMLHLKAFFGTRKVKVISKDDVRAYSRTEGARVRDEYRMTGGKLTNFDELKAFENANKRYVANMLKIKITADSNGIIADSIFWYNTILPINFGKPQKDNTKFMVLDSLNSTSLLKLSQSLVDSIIASNILAKEE